MVEADLTGLLAWCNKESDRFGRAHGVPLTVRPLFVHAVAAALRAFPLMNASFTDAGIAVHADVNIGIATTVDGSRAIPVLHFADRLSLTQSVLAVHDLIARASAGALGAHDLVGGTFTARDGGAHRALLADSPLTPGQTGFLTMGSVTRRPVVRGEGIAVRDISHLCLSLDHRVVDGAVATAFLNDVKRRLEAVEPGAPAWA